MSRPITARRAAHHGVPKNAMTQSPYRGAWVEVVAANMAGCHVELTSAAGVRFLVDRMHPIWSVKS